MSDGPGQASASSKCLHATARRWRRSRPARRRRCRSGAPRRRGPSWRRCLPAAANLATAARGRGLRGLAAGVRVHLGVEHEHVDVATGTEHVIEAAGADVVRPTVAADDPDVLADQGSSTRSTGAPWRRVRVGTCASGERFVERGDPLALGRDRRTRRPLLGDPASRLGKLAAEVGASSSTSARASRPCGRGRGGCPRPNSALSSNREFDQAGPATRRRSCPTAWSGGCRRRSTSSRWRWPRSSGRRTAA